MHLNVCVCNGRENKREREIDRWECARVSRKTEKDFLSRGQVFYFKHLR